MPTRVSLKVQAGNRETVRLQVTTPNGTPVPLTERDLEFVVKKYSSDTDLQAVVRSTLIAGSVVAGVATSYPIAVTDAGQGRLEVDVDFSRHGRYSWRLDVITSGRRSTALYGTLEVEPL